MRVSTARWSSATRTVVGLSLLVSLPLLVALVALGREHWNPVLDLAMTEFRVRDVGSRHTPLIGLPGRIGDQPNQGSHPGPLSFYLLAPTYRLLGSTSFALEVGSVLIHAAAIAAALVLAYRRGGTRLCLAIAAMLAVVLRGYGANVLTQPWNPYLPLIAFVVVLLAVWSVLEGDAMAMVFFVAAGSLCMQTHIPYLGMVAGLGGFCLVWIVVRSRIGAFDASVPMPDLKRWSIVSIVLGVLLWLPPVADQLRHDPGNGSKLSDYFRDPPMEAIGLRNASQLLFEHFNVFRLGVQAFNESDYFKSTAFTINGSSVPGALVVLAWAVCAMQAWRLRHRALIHLHAVLATSMLLAVVSMSRIFGIVWYYLMFWLWSIVVLALVAMAWTIAATVARARASLPRARQLVTRVSTAFVSAVLALSTMAFSWSAGHVDPPEAYLSRPLDALIAPTAAAIDAGVGAATGRDGRYAVLWRDAAFFGSQGYGVLNELDRRGYHVGSAPYFYTTATPWRVVDPQTATAEIVFATGGYIEQIRSAKGVVEVAFTDPRTTQQRATYDTLSAEVKARLNDEGLAELADAMDLNLFGVQLDQRVPRSINVLIDKMLQLGQPTAIFIAPPGTVG